MYNMLGVKTFFSRFLWFFMGMTWSVNTDQCLLTFFKRIKSWLSLNRFRGENSFVNVVTSSFRYHIKVEYIFTVNLPIWKF
jgi:hypothetical protein